MSTNVVQMSTNVVQICTNVVQMTTNVAQMSTNMESDAMLLGDEVSCLAKLRDNVEGSLPLAPRLLAVESGGRGERGLCTAEPCGGGRCPSPRSGFGSAKELLFGVMCDGGQPLMWG
jgi:hypothetical protein